MYRDHETATFIGRQSATFLVVVAFHIMLGAALYSGLASRIYQRVILSDVIVRHIVTPKIRETATLPPPVAQTVKPWIPVPEFPSIDPGTTDDNGIRDTNSKVPTTSLPPTTQTHASTAVRMDPRHPLKVGREHYPDDAVRREEQGRCIVNLTVAADGRVREATLKASSGFASLDRACIDAVRDQRMIPATTDGKPVESTVSMPIVWRLSDR